MRGEGQDQHRGPRRRAWPMRRRVRTDDRHGERPRPDESPRRRAAGAGRLTSAGRAERAARAARGSPGRRAPAPAARACRAACGRACARGSRGAPVRDGAGDGNRRDGHAGRPERRPPGRPERRPGGRPVAPSSTSPSGGLEMGPHRYGRDRHECQPARRPPVVVPGHGRGPVTPPPEWWRVATTRPMPAASRMPAAMFQVRSYGTRFTWYRIWCRPKSYSWRADTPTHRAEQRSAGEVA